MTQKKTKPEVKEEYRPMGVPEPSPAEQIEALILRVQVLEGQYKDLEGLVTQHNRYHFGKTT